MVSLFYPTTDTRHPIAPYTTAGLAQLGDLIYGFPQGTIESINTQSYASARVKEIKDIPIAFFSPGLGSVRAASTILFEGLASYGYLVVAIDHTYDAAAVQFPDGTIVQGIPINGDPQSLDVRTKDTSFILNQLSNASWVAQIPGIVHRSLNTEKVAMFGHSLGGSTTLSALENDKRIIGGASLDGPFIGAEITLGTKKPFLFIGRENHTRHTDPLWAETYKHLDGWKAELELQGSTHLTFVDDSALFTEMGILGLVDPTGATYGTINGIRATLIEIAYLKAFFDYVFGKGKDDIFRKNDPKYPEIVII